MKKEQTEFEIFASIEENQSQQWRINIFDQVRKEEEKNVLSIGDVIWLKLSEKQFFLTAHRGGDPIENLFNRYSRIK